MYIITIEAITINADGRTLHTGTWATAAGSMKWAVKKAQVFALIFKDEINADEVIHIDIRKVE